MTTDNEKLDALSEALREQRNALDAHTASRLNQARQRALQELDRPARDTLGWLPVGVAATVLAAVALVSLNMLQPVPSPQQAASPDLPNLELMFAETDLEMLEEVEFYLWLESKETTSVVSTQFEGMI